MTDHHVAAVQVRDLLTVGSPVPGQVPGVPGWSLISSPTAIAAAARSLCATYGISATEDLMVRMEGLSNAG